MPALRRDWDAVSGLELIAGSGWDPDRGHSLRRDLLAGGPESRMDQRLLIANSLEFTYAVYVFTD